MTKPHRPLSIRGTSMSAPLSPAGWKMLFDPMNSKATEPITATVNAFGQTLRGEFGEDALRASYELHSYHLARDHTKAYHVAGSQVPIRFRLYLPMDKHNRVQVGWSWAGLVERKPMLVQPWELLGGWNLDWQWLAGESYDVSASFQLKDDDGVREIGKLTIECRAIVERIEQLDPMSHLCGVAGGNGVVAVDMVSVGDVVRRFVEYR